MNRKLGKTGAVVFAAIATVCCASTASAGTEVTAAQFKNSYGTELQVLGDIEGIDLTRGVLLVAGQHVSIGKETAFSYNGLPVDDQALALRMIQPGDLLAVFGPLDAPARAISRLKEAYVPGATPVFVKAKVASVQPSVGRAKIDELGVDLTPAMSDPQFAQIEAGEVIEAVGIRPNAGGILVANSVSPSSIVGTSAAATRSIVGTSAAVPKSIVGTSSTAPRSIVGTS